MLREAVRTTWSLFGVAGIAIAAALMLSASAHAAESQTRYSLVHGCYSLSPEGAVAVGKQNGGYAVGASAQRRRV
jgi:hypothetical protein